MKQINSKSPLHGNCLERITSTKNVKKAHLHYNQFSHTRAFPASLYHDYKLT